MHALIPNQRAFAGYEPTTNGKTEGWWAVGQKADEASPGGGHRPPDWRLQRERPYQGTPWTTPKSASSAPETVLGGLPGGK
eukprot:4521528-Alexandrium_andersonii.AAC.1